MMKIDFLNKKKELPYANVEFYAEEMRRVNGEIKEINKTIKYYESKRKSLEDWTDELRIKIKKEKEEQACKNCKFYKYGEKYCLKHKSHVNGEAYCLDFEWSV